MDDSTIEDFRQSLEDYERKSAYHDYKIDGNKVTFEGGWEASHEAWLFRRWLENNGKKTAFGRTRHGNKDPKTVVVASDVDAPDWVDVTLRGTDHVVLEVKNKRRDVERKNVDDAAEELRKELWREIQSVSGVGKSTVETIADTYDTPMDAQGEWESVDGVGPSTAESLDSFMEVWS